MRRRSMKMLIAFAAATAVCAGPALAQVGELGGGCDRDPETMGAPRADPRSLHLPGERPDEILGKLEVTPPEEGWQGETEETSEQRQRDALACAGG